jgi:hypothetical protein
MARYSIDGVILIEDNIRAIKHSITAVDELIQLVKHQALLPAKQRELLLTTAGALATSTAEDLKHLANDIFDIKDDIIDDTT